MKLSKATPTLALKAYLETSFTDVIVYPSGIPTSNLPNDFMAISLNGAIVADSYGAQILSCTLMVGVYVKLSNGVANEVRENFLLSKFEDLFPIEFTHSSVKYKCSLDLNNLVYSGRSLLSGYSTKALNLKVTIYLKK